MAKKKDNKKAAKESKPAKPKKAGKGGGFDTTKIKEFCISHGERVGLGVAGFLMILFLFYGLILAFSSSSPHKELQNLAQNLNSSIMSSEPPAGTEVAVLPTNPDWKISDPTNLESTVFFDPNAVGDNKVTNPAILPPGNPKLIDVVIRSPKNPAIQETLEFEFEILRDSETKNIVTKQLPIMQDCKVDLVRAPIFRYEVNGNKVEHLEDVKAKKAGAGGAAVPPTAGGEYSTGQMGSGYELTRYLEPSRIVVVTATFPYDLQLENYQKALRKDNIASLFYSESTIPWFNGLIVKRGELTGGKGPINWKEWETIYGISENGDIVLNDKLKDMYQKAVLVDEQTSVAMGVGGEGSPTYTPPVSPMPGGEMGGSGGMPTAFPPEIQPGLVCALPKLAFGEYPPIDLPGLKLDLKKPADLYDPSSAMPGTSSSETTNPLLQGFPMGQPTTPQGASKSGLTIKELELADLAKKDDAKAIRFLGKVYPYRYMGAGNIPKYGFYPFYPDGQYHGPKEFFSFAQQGSEGMNPMPTGIPGETSPMNPFATGPVPPPGGKEADPFGINTPKELKKKEKRLIRFIDVDVEPGKTYIYSVQVRMANPNFNHPERVAFKALSEEKELLSPVVWTPPITIDPELHYYVVNQDLLSPKWLYTHKAKDFFSTDKGVTIQIHRWVKDFITEPGNRRYKLGTWVVADQLTVHRGEQFGKNDVKIQVPEWSPTQGFSLTAEPTQGKSNEPKDSKESKSFGLVDFQPEFPAPLVVDYKGGRKTYYDAEGRYLPDEGAVQMLLLSSDGKLELYDGWQDSNPRELRGKERAERFQGWQDLIDKMKKATQPPPMFDPNNPPITGSPNISCGPLDEE